MSWQPINSANALETVVWSIGLSEPLVRRHQDAIEAKEEKIKALLPVKAIGGKLSFQLTPSGAPAVVLPGDDPNEPAGLTYSRLAPNGPPPELEFDIGVSALTLVNRCYEKWERSGREAMRLFRIVSRMLEDPLDVPVAHFELVYKDVFWWDDHWQGGCLRELLEVHPKLAPEWMFDVQSLWHHDVGEIITYDDDDIVERLSINCLDGQVNNEPKRVVVLATTTRWLARDAQMGLHTAFMRNGGGDVGSKFNLMHRIAGHVIRRVLSRRMLKRIGITQ